MTTKPIYDKAFWDQRYQTDSYIYGENPNEFLVESLGHLEAGGKMLCLSEGEGRNAVYLASKGFQVTGVDLSVVAKDKALKLAARNQVTLHYDVADLTHYDLGEARWNGILSIFGHLPSALRKNLHPRIKQALKPGGVFLLLGYNLRQLAYESGGPKDPDMLYLKEDLAKDFGDFEILLLEDRMRSFIEGDKHLGAASVTQFIARKKRDP